MLSQSQCSYCYVWALPVYAFCTCTQYVGICTGLNRYLTCKMCICNRLSTWSWTLYGALQTCRHVGVCAEPLSTKESHTFPSPFDPGDEDDAHLACVQTEKVQWELFSLPAVISSQVFLLIQSVSKLHSQEKIKPTQSACVCITLLNRKAWELFSFDFVLVKFNVVLCKENKKSGNPNLQETLLY